MLSARQGAGWGRSQAWLRAGRLHCPRFLHGQSLSVALGSAVVSQPRPGLAARHHTLASPAQGALGGHLCPFMACPAAHPGLGPLQRVPSLRGRAASTGDAGHHQPLLPQPALGGGPGHSPADSRRHRKQAAERTVAPGSSAVAWLQDPAGEARVGSASTGLCRGACGLSGECVAGRPECPGMTEGPPYRGLPPPGPADPLTSCPSSPVLPSCWNYVLGDRPVYFPLKSSFNSS